MIKKENFNVIETYCPIFSGFYNTIFEPDFNNLDWQLFNNPNNIKPEILDFINNSITDFFNNKDYKIKTCKLIIEWFNNYFKENNLQIKFKFQELISPKYYNYSNDSIDIKVLFTDNFLLFLKDYINNNIDKFNIYIKDNYTSYNGFTSFHSNNYKDWINYLNKDDLKNKKHYMGSFLDFYFSNENLDKLDLYYYCNEIYSICEFFNEDDLINNINKEFNLKIENLSELENI